MKIRITVAHPTQRTDDSPLVLDHWRVRHNESGGQVAGPDLAPGVTVYDFDGVSLGEEHVFAVDWFDEHGQQSAIGFSVTVTAPALPAPPKAGTVVSTVILP
jgi:hypothetical protein